MRIATQESTRFSPGRLFLFIPLIFTMVLMFCADSEAQDRVNIIDLHNNNSDGTPAAPYGIGTNVTINGVVTVGYGVFTTDYTDVWVQDDTGGIMVYNYGVPYQFDLGDSVTIDGSIDQYRGLTEVVLSTWTVHSSGAAVPEPLVVTCDDIEHAFQPDYSEPNEGRLVRINNVSWTGSWPSFSGPITLHDESGICILYIDGTTGIQNMSPPAGSFDVVGVVKQYAGYTPPYTSDYELMPRSTDDFYIHAGPQIVDGPRETELQANSVTIHIETSTASTAVVSYGLTASYEMGTTTDGISSTTHDILVGGLDPATVYHYEVELEDVSGLTTTPDRLFSSASAPGGTGTIQAIFNKSVDHDVASYEPALGGQNLEGWMIDRINATDATLDVAIYSFDLPAVADAIIAAKDRGVQIRFIYDNRDTYQTEVTRLINNGITVIDDAYGANTGNGIMHHKLWVFDANSADPADPWVFTGSWNLSTQGTYTDAQNVVMIQDQALAKTCTLEMDEMWGSSGAVPNSANSSFGTNKTDNTPKIFNVGGIEIEIYFAPSDPWLGALIDQVETADYSINFCILSYTRFDLTNEMEERWMFVPGMKIRGVFDSGESGNPGSQYFPMNGEGDYAWDPPADVMFDGETGSLHHKYMIIDVDHPLSSPVIATGSANFSNAAVGTNDENHIIIHDPVTANKYFQEFSQRYQAAGGGDDLTSDVEVASPTAGWFRVGPNPAPFRLQTAFALSSGGRVVCELYSVDGRRVEKLIDRVMTGGSHTISMDLERNHGLVSGIYYIRLSTPDGVYMRRVTLLR